jgi:hypothetical protein
MKRVLVVSAALLAVGMSTAAKAKPPCNVYFSVVQVGPSLPDGQAEWLNPRQKSWFEQHGDQGKLAGICYDPAKANYLIRWTGEQVNRSDGELLIQALPAQDDVAASGRLFRIGKSETPAPLKTLSENIHSGSGRSTELSASVALLKHGLEAIAKAEKATAKSPDRSPAKGVSF